MLPTSRPEASCVEPLRAHRLGSMGEAAVDHPGDIRRLAGGQGRPEGDGARPFGDGDLIIRSGRITSSVTGLELR